MNKREFMQEIWVHISKRLPPADKWDFVATYNSQNGYMNCFPSSCANTYAKLCLANKGEELSWDRRFTHWMPLYAPGNGITYDEYITKNHKARI